MQDVGWMCDEHSLARELGIEIRLGIAKGFHMWTNMYTGVDALYGDFGLTITH